jgi:peptidoglycan/LPS O-acetylase OafA/YrhL/O-antigen/teichoic acid export membrane protein
MLQMSDPLAEAPSNGSATFRGSPGGHSRLAIVSKITAVIAKSGKRAFWPLADQGVVSLGNLFTLFIVARGLPRSDFGTFTLIIEAMFFFISIHAALITYPLTVVGAVADMGNLRRKTAAALALTLFMALPVAVASIAVACYFQLMAVGIVAIVSLLAWQLQEVVRRALLSHFRYTEAIWGDGVNYLGQAAVLVVLGYLGRLTLLSALGAIGSTSVLALLIQAAQVGLARLERGELLAVAKDFWIRGRWLALTNSSSISLMLCGNWALGLSHGREDIADFAAIAALLKIVNPVLQTIGNLIVPAAAKAFDRGGIAAAQRVAVRITASAGLLVAPIFLVLWIAPNWCLGLAYHGKYSGHQFPVALRFVVVGYVLIYLNTAATSFLNGVNRTRYTFYGQIASSIAMFAVLLPLNIAYGWIGYAAGGVMPVFIQFIVLLWCLRKSDRTPAPALQSSEIGREPEGESALVPHIELYEGVPLQETIAAPPPELRAVEEELIPKPCPPQASGRIRLEVLDAIRGLAALCVVFFHIHQIVDPITQTLSKPFRVLALLTNQGHDAVVVFIVLSGFVLTIPVARTTDLIIPGGLALYIKRRARRILPPFYSALVIFLLLGGIWHLASESLAAHGVPASVNPFVSVDATADGVLAHAVLIFNFRRDWAMAVDSPMWSVATEWQIYFLFPLILLPLWRRAGIAAAVVGGFAVGIIPVLVAPRGTDFDTWCPWLLGVFALGMAAAACAFGGPIKWIPGGFNRGVKIWGAGCLMVVAAIGVIQFSIPRLWYAMAEWQKDVMTGAAVAMLLVYLARWQLTGLDGSRGKPIIFRLLDTRAAITLGAFSYSLYLVHLPFLIVLEMLVSRLVHGGKAHVVVMYVAGTLLALVSGYLFHLAFERPFCRPRPRA